MRDLNIVLLLSVAGGGDEMDMLGLAAQLQSNLANEP
jgi:hypothetical protein